MPVVLSSVAEIQARTGQLIGHSGWKTLPFSQIQAFAEATGDHQWIHVDEARIARESPFKVPIAHGYLTLSLVAGLFFDVVAFENFPMILNYGCGKVRFPAPLTAGSRYRLALTLQGAAVIPAAQQGGAEWLELTMAAAIEVEGSKKPACAAEVIYRLLPARAA